MESLMNRPWKRMMAAGCVLLACALSAQAQLSPATVLEASVETTSAGVHFPSSLSGRILVQGCPQCVDQALQLDAHTQFFVNGQATTLAKVAAAALGAAGDSVTIHFRLKDKVVTRVDLTVFPS
jgi:hypothetical protein